MRQVFGCLGLRVPSDAGYKTLDMYSVQAGFFDFIDSALVRPQRKGICVSVRGEVFGALGDCKACHRPSLFFDRRSSGCAVGEVLLRAIKEDCRLQVLHSVLKDGTAAQNALTSYRPRPENRCATDVGILGVCNLTGELPDWVEECHQQPLHVERCDMGEAEMEVEKVKRSHLSEPSVEKNSMGNDDDDVDDEVYDGRNDEERFAERRHARVLPSRACVGSVLTLATAPPLHRQGCKPSEVGSFVLGQPFS